MKNIKLQTFVSKKSSKMKQETKNKTKTLDPHKTMDSVD